MDPSCHMEARKTTGIVACPPVMYRIFAAWLTICCLLLGPFALLAQENFDDLSLDELLNLEIVSASKSGAVFPI